MELQRKSSLCLLRLGEEVLDRKARAAVLRRHAGIRSSRDELGIFTPFSHQTAFHYLSSAESGGVGLVRAVEGVDGDSAICAN